MKKDGRESVEVKGPQGLMVVLRTSQEDSPIDSPATSASNEAWDTLKAGAETA